MAEITEEMKKLIEENALAFATTGRDGNPHCIAVAFVKILGNKIIITDNYMSETVRNLKENNNVAIAVWNKNWQKDCKGFEIKGTAEYLTEGKWLALVKKIHKGFPAKAAILVAAEKIKNLS